MKIFNAILSISFFLWSCSTRPTDEKEIFTEDTIKTQSKRIITVDTVEMDDEETGIPPPRYVTDPKEMQILTYTDTLYKGDTLRLKFKVPHSKDLAITTPDDKFFFIVYAQNDEQKPSLVNWDKFASLDYLEVVTDKTKANLWDATVKENQIMLSENLETDDGTPVELKTVYYIHKPRKL